MTLFLLGSKDTTVLLVHGNFIFLLNPNNLFLFHLPALSNGYDHTDTSIMIPRLIASTTEHKFFNACYLVKQGGVAHTWTHISFGSASLKVNLLDSESGSLYALCRSWVRNGVPHESQVSPLFLFQMTQWLVAQIFSEIGCGSFNTKFL